MTAAFIGASCLFVVRFGAHQAQSRANGRSRAAFEGGPEGGDQLLPWYRQRHEAASVRRTWIVRRFQGDLHRGLTGRDIERDRVIAEVRLVVPAIAATNNRKAHRRSPEVDAATRMPTGCRSAPGFLLPVGGDVGDHPLGERDRLNLAR